MRFSERIAGKKLFDTPLCDHHGRIVVRVIRVSATLTDKLGLGQPIVRGSESALSAFLRTIRRWDGDDKFALTQRFIGGKRDDLSPSRRQDGPVKPGFGCRFIGQKPSLGIRLGLGVLSHVGDRQGLEYIQIIVVMDDQGMCIFRKIVNTDFGKS